MKKLVLGLALGGLLLAFVVQAQVGPRGDLYGARALQSLEQAFKTTGVLTFPNYPAAPVVCNVPNYGVYYYDTTLTDAYICGAAGWVVVGGALTVGAANTIPKWNAVPDDLVDTYMVELPIPAANAGGDILTQAGTVNSMDNNDTIRLFYMNWVNAAHAGANNFLFGLDVEGIVQDDQATEVMFHAGDGWDIDLGFADADSLNIAPLGMSNMVTVYDVPATGTTGSLVEISATFDAMDATIQTYRGLYITLIEPAPAAAISMVHGIDIASLNAIGYILDSAIYIDSGWLADIRFNEPDAHVIWAEGGTLEFSDWSIWEGLTVPGDPHNQVIFRDAAADNAVPVALVEIDPLLSIMDAAGDVQRVLYLDIDNVNHADGAVYGIDLDLDAQDAQADEYGIYIGDEWDIGIAADESTVNLSGINIDSGLIFEDAVNSGAPTLQVWRDNGANFINFTGKLNFGMRWQSSASTINHNFMEFNYTAGNADGADTKSVINIDVDAGNPAGANNFLNLISIDALTGDSNTNLNAIYIGALTGSAPAVAETEYAINVQAGWDAAFHHVGIAHADLAAAANGSLVFCTDCDPATTPCTTVGAQSGAFAFRVNGQWDCPW